MEMEIFFHVATRLIKLIKHLSVFLKLKRQKKKHIHCNINTVSFTLLKEGNDICIHKFNKTINCKGSNSKKVKKVILHANTRNYDS